MRNKDEMRRNGYYFIGDKKYVSVTTVLQIIAKPALITWAAKEAATAAIENPEFDVSQSVSAIYQKRDKAGKMGSTIHSLVEAFGNTQKIDFSVIPKNILPYAVAFCAFFSVHKPKIMHTECTIVNEKEGYAGTPDLIATMSDGLIWLMDYKTGSGVYDEVKLQLEAYKHGEYIIKKPENTKIALPKIDKMAAIHLKDNGTFSFIEQQGDFKVFLATKKLWEWFNPEKKGIVENDKVISNNK